jgi:hypothetical protein
MIAADRLALVVHEAATASGGVDCFGEMDSIEAPMGRRVTMATISINIHGDEITSRSCSRN